jgi:hypothetical protein
MAKALAVTTTTKETAITAMSINLFFISLLKKVTIL